MWVFYFHTRSLMQLYEVILIGIAMSIDACALTISNCTTYKDSLNRKKELAMPITFGLFQGVMPLLGYFIGSLFKSFIGSALKFISAAIFLVLAIKIVVDLLKERNQEIKLSEVKTAKSQTAFTFAILLIQGIATSIDAFVIGITLVSVTFSIYLAVLIIAAVTFILVLLALFFGKCLGKIFGSYAKWLGAAILFALSIKEFIEAII